MYTLILIRHGESLWNRENRFTGWVDVDLSDKGVAEANKAGQLLKDAGFTFDIAFTSYLKRAIRTLWIVLDKMDLMWIPVHKSWRLNERHYGALTGLKKDDMAKKYGEEQILIWRRSYDIRPEPVDESSPYYPGNDKRYAALPKEMIPHSECLKDNVERIIPYWEENIAPAILAKKQVIVSSHGNALRSLIKHMTGMSEEDILAFNVPTGVPLLFKLDKDLNVISYEFLGDQEEINKAIQAVKSQGKSQ